MLSYTFIDGFTGVSRTEAVERLQRAIADAGGVIVDLAFFGWEAIRMTVEIDAAGLGILRSDLEAAEVELFPRCLNDLDAAKRMSATHAMLAMLHIAIIQPTDVLSTPVPKHAW